MARQRPQLSVVVPAYNEEENIPTFYKHLAKVLRTLPSHEIIFVNDGSRDNTLHELHKLARRNKQVRIVSFSRNFGKEIATSAGIHHARGEAIIMLDADGQFPVELIPKFVKKWQQGAQIVTGIRQSNQKEGPIKRYGSRLFYRLLSSMTATAIRPGSTDFRLIDKSVQREFIRFTERGRITRGLLDWVGFRQATITFHARPRLAGEASYKIAKLIRLAMNSFVSLSLTPLYFSGYAGLVITPVAFVLGLFVLVEQLLLGDPLGLDISGTAMLGILILFFVGILLISQGLIALYISHIHTETQNRPLYIIDEVSSRNLAEQT